MESRVGEHQTPAWRRNNPALEWSCDQALKERGDWDELITGVSDRLQLRRSHAPCHTHTDTGKEERQEIIQTQNTNTTHRLPWKKLWFEAKLTDPHFLCPVHRKVTTFLTSKTGVSAKPSPSCFVCWKQMILVNTLFSLKNWDRRLMAAEWKRSFQ